MFIKVKENDGKEHFVPSGNIKVDGQEIEAFVKKVKNLEKELKNLKKELKKRDADILRLYKELNE